MGLLSPTQGKLMVERQEIIVYNLRYWQLNNTHGTTSYLSGSTFVENISFGVEPKKIDM
jgi:hypothetical protein